MMKTHHWHRFLVAMALLAPLALVGGCGIFSPEEVKDPPEVTPPAPYPLATDQDILIANFIRAYNERNYAEFDNLLHDEYLFYLSDEDVNAGADRTFDRARELEATYNMFNGVPGRKPDGSEQPPIRSITLQLTADGEPWSDEVGPEYEGTTRKRYEVDMTVEYVADRPSAVVGLQEFYAIPVEHDNGDGTVTTIYKLKFWRDLGREGF